MSLSTTLAAAPDAATDVLAAVGDTSGLQTWISDNVIGILVLVAGAVIILKAFNKNSHDNAGAMRIVGIVILGLVVAGVAVTGGWEDIGTWAAGLIGIGGDAAADPAPGQ